MKTKKLNLNELQNIEGGGVAGIVYYNACMMELSNWGHYEESNLSYFNSIHADYTWIPMSTSTAHSYCRQFLGFPF
jgi:bacteriocin-like protein